VSNFIGPEQSEDVVKIWTGFSKSQRLRK